MRCIVQMLLIFFDFYRPLGFKMDLKLVAPFWVYYKLQRTFYASKMVKSIKFSSYVTLTVRNNLLAGLSFSKCMVISCIAAGIYLLKVNNRNTRAKYKTCSKLTIKTSGRRHWRCSGVFRVNLEHILHFVLVFIWLKRTFNNLLR